MSETIRRQTFVEGNSVNISCNADDAHNMTIWWTKRETNSTFHQDGAVLRFDVINRTDSGVYLCFARNSSKDDNGTVIVDGIEFYIECKC